MTGNFLSSEGQGSSDMDHVVCGSCGENFGLAKLPEFIEHKQFSCQGSRGKQLMCQSCLQKFSSPWSLLQHAQALHSFKLFFDEVAPIPSIKSAPPSSTLSTPDPKNRTNRSVEEKVKKVPALPTTSSVNISAIKQVNSATVSTLSASCTDKTSPQMQSVAIDLNGQKHLIQSTTASVKESSNVAVLGNPASVSASLVKVVPVTERVRTEANSVLKVLPHIPVLQPITLPHGAVFSATLTPGALAPRIIAYNSLPRQPVVTSVEESVLLTPATATNIGNELAPTKKSEQLTPLSVTTFAAQSDTTTKELTLQKETIDISKPQELSPAKTLKVVSSSVTENQIPIVPSTTQLLQDSELKIVQVKSSLHPGIAAEAKLPHAIVLAQPRTATKEQKLNGSKNYKGKSCACCAGGDVCDISDAPSSSACQCGPVIPPTKEVLPSDPSVAATSLNAPELSGKSEVAPVVTKSSEELKLYENSEPASDIGAKDGEKEDAEGEDGIQCCNNQDCGVTIMPGTHESLKKCCNAVVPKKRKRHMETKHRIKKRATEASYAPEENTIYIDFQTNSDIPCVSASNPGVTVSTDDTRGTITVNTSTALMEPETMLRSQSQRSLTLSIPVSYTRKAPCPLIEWQRPVKLPPDQAQDHMRGCRCDCCPLALQLLNSVRDRKTRRRSNSSEAKRDAANANDPGEELRQIIANVKTENLLDEKQKSEESGLSKSGISRIKGLKKSSILISQGAMNKKRRYPTSRPFKCDQCELAFNQRIHLKKHQSKHTGIKPYKCEQCDYSTVERSHLKVHIRVHTGEKPFKCSHCEYATAQNSTLKIHLKRHHGQDPGQEHGNTDSISCLQCQQIFDTEELYQSHLETGECTDPIPPAENQNQNVSVLVGETPVIEGSDGLSDEKVESTA